MAVIKHKRSNVASDNIDALTFTTDMLGHNRKLLTKSEVQMLNNYTRDGKNLWFWLVLIHNYKVNTKA